ncbi:MAG: hypothetical protein R6U38_16700 [Desulfatiglandaceae bacterium]
MYSILDIDLDMVKVLRDSQRLAIKKIQEIVEQAVDISANTVTIEFAEEGGLEVLFGVGHRRVGGILVDRTLEAAVMRLIHQRAGLEKRLCGMMHWESQGQDLKIRVEEYDSFGETAYKLKFPKR